MMRKMSTDDVAQVQRGMAERAGLRADAENYQYAHAGGDRR